MIFHLTAKPISFSYLYVDVYLRLKQVSEKHCLRQFLKLIAEKEVILALLVEFYLLKLVRMGYSV